MKSTIFFLELGKSKQKQTEPYLNDTGMVAEIEKGEATVDPVERDPPAEADPFTHVGVG
jgi:hypothetical protein